MSVDHTDSASVNSRLFEACKSGDVSLVQTLIHDHKANINTSSLPIHIAALSGNQELVLTLIKEFGYDTKVTYGLYGRSLLHYACNGGNVSLVQTLIRDYKANIHARDSNGNLPIHVAALAGKKEVVLTLINKFECDTKVKGQRSKSLLHDACYGGNVSLVSTLILDYEADINARDSTNNLPIHVAALEGNQEVVLTLIKNFRCDTKGQNGISLLHHACSGGNVSLVRILILDYEIDINVRDSNSDLPIHVAALAGKEEVVLTLIKDFRCDFEAKGKYGGSLLHRACEGGNVSLVKTLIRDYKANIYAQDNNKDLPIHVAVLAGKEAVMLTLIKDFSCSTEVNGQDGWSLLHKACDSGNVGLVRTLILDYEADIYARDSDKDLPIHVAALAGKEEVVLTLIEEFRCDSEVKGHYGRSLLHCACYSGNVNLVRTLIRKQKADINVCDSYSDLPIHVAAYRGQREVVLTLIKEFGCDTKVKGQHGRSLLHGACYCGNVNLVQTLMCDYKNKTSNSDSGNDCNAGLPRNRELIGQGISPLVTDDDGDTPLHECASQGHSECVEALLQMNAPVLVKNKDGESPIDVAQGEARRVLTEYVRVNEKLIHTDYRLIQEKAKKKYSSAEHLTRLFVIGNPGSGKSSLIETLKREGRFDSFRRVSEASVPPHTTGIVPSIHTSKIYGRVLFYDFAGDPEYYSSHAAILESISKSRKGDNIFIIVVNMQENFKTVSDILYYWLSFIQHLHLKSSSIIIIGSHLDVATNKAVRVYESVFCKLATEFTQSVSFMVDCCQPKSKELGLLQNHIVDLTKASPRYALSLYASTLLGVLEKDFSQVSACSVQKILSHIEVTGITLPRDPTGLFPVLFELHELGLLFLTQDTATSDLQVVLNVTKLTEEVHKLLFSKEASQNLIKCIESEDSASFNVGILPRTFLAKVLPEYIAERCLIQLQYCQEIKHRDVNAFPAIEDSPHDTFLFFPALCKSDKSDTPLVTHPAELSYSMGWLARCTDPRDYFPPRFLHVLLLRLVFEFTLSVPTQDQASSTSSDLHLQRRCVMWRTGVHWLMEEGVECLVEMVREHGIIKGVVVSVQSEKEASIIENCISVFNSIIKCVMQAKAEFCHSIKPKFYLLDSPEASNFLNEDHMFAMSDVQRVLTSPGQQKKMVVSVSGHRQMERSKIAFLLELSYWNNLFSVDFASVLYQLKEVVRDLHSLGIYLKISPNSLEAMEYNFPRDVEKQKIELVSEWLRSTKNPPCWWHLVQALEKIPNRALAEEIRAQHGDHIHLQERLLSAEYQDTKPDAQFLEQFAALKEVEWEPLASLLSLTGPEIEEVRSKGEGPLAQQDPALLTLKMWATRDEAMYGHLCQLLKTITLFHYT